jgi:ribose transport system ATP-binding protein
MTNRRAVSNTAHSTSENTAPLLAMRGIRKSFGGVEVLHGVDLTLNGGEVLALLGENGAGKSTLMKILGGDYARDGGEILVDGAPLDLRSPRDAEHAGIRIIYQELNYAPDLSVAENVLMGHLPRRPGLLGIDWREAYRRTAEILATLKTDIDPRTPVGRLSVGRQQLVEIAKALSSKARILVMDEPTAALTSREVHLLFETIASLRAQGVGLIYISHRLDEVEQVAQRITVLRDGNVAGDVAMADVSRADIVRMMVGRAVEALYPARHGEPGEPILEVENLTRPGAFENVSFTVRAGEIVGLYGLMGAGQTEVTRALFGVAPATSGQIRVAGRPVRTLSPREGKAGGIGLVPEDRKREGLVLGMSVADNLTLGNWKAISRGGVFQRRREAERAAHWMGRLGIRARGGVGQAVGTLSGGNQQKVVLARWLEAGSRVLLLSEPTRGVDVGARADIYAVLEELREQGLALALVSSDMEEVLALSDRTLVFVRGRIVAEFDRARASQEALLGAAAGEGAQAAR